MWTASLRILRELIGHGGSLTIGVPERWAVIFENLPFLSPGSDRIIQIPKQKLSLIAKVLKLRKRFDFILVFHASTGMALMARTLGLLTGATCIINHHELFHRKDFSQIPVPGHGVIKANIDRDLDVLRAITPLPSLAELGEKALPIIAQPHRALRSPGPLRLEKIFLGIGASRSTKAWSETSFLTVVDDLSKKFPALEFIIAGVSPELSAYQSLLQHPKIRVFRDRPLAEVKDVLVGCDLYIGNDSGLKHMAVALGIRSITIFGPESPLEWHPYPTQDHRILYIPDLACRTESGKHWCDIPSCPVYHNKCLSLVSPQDVLKEVQWLQNQK